MICRRLTYCFVALAFCTTARAADYRVEALDAPPPEEVSAAIVEALSPTGYKVIRGENRTVCELWLCKAWDVKPDFAPSMSVLYPFESGQLLGVVRYPRRGGDFRAQQIDKGVYTMRYGLQPVDGNHVGTSDTRDFVLLCLAAKDTDAAPLGEQPLVELSTEAAQTTHPAMLAMLSSQIEGDAPPAVRNDEDRELVSVRLHGKSAADDKDVLVEVVVVGESDG